MSRQWDGMEFNEGYNVHIFMFSALARWSSGAH